MKRRITSIVIVSAILFVLMASPFAAKVYAAPTWTVTIGARLGSFSSSVTLGVANDATNGFDVAYDAAAPPAPADGIISYFAYPLDPTPALRKLSTSIIPPSGNMNWTLKVQTVGETGTLVLNWTAIPGGYSAKIWDSTNTTILADMTQTTQYSTTADADVTITFTVNFVIPEFPIAPIIALVVFFASYGAFKGLKRLSYPIA